MRSKTRRVQSAFERPADPEAFPQSFLKVSTETNSPTPHALHSSQHIISINKVIYFVICQRLNSYQNQSDEAKLVTWCIFLAGPSVLCVCLDVTGTADWLCCFVSPAEWRCVVPQGFLTRDKGIDVESLDSLLKNKNIPEGQQEAFKRGFAEGFLKAQALTQRTQGRF